MLTFPLFPSYYYHDYLRLFIRGEILSLLESQQNVFVLMNLPKWLLHNPHLGIVDKVCLHLEMRKVIPLNFSSRLVLFLLVYRVTVCSSYDII